jgi:hypothetical protein
LPVRRPRGINACEATQRYPWNSDAGSGVTSTTAKDLSGTNPTDTGVSNNTRIQESLVQDFVNTFGPAETASG